MPTRRIDEAQGHARTSSAGRAIPEKNVRVSRPRADRHAGSEAGDGVRGEGRRPRRGQLTARARSGRSAGWTRGTSTSRRSRRRLPGLEHGTAAWCSTARTTFGPVLDAAGLTISTASAATSSRFRVVGAHARTRPGSGRSDPSRPPSPGGHSVYGDAAGCGTSPRSSLPTSAADREVLGEPERQLSAGPDDASAERPGAARSPASHSSPSGRRWRTRAGGP